MTFKNPSPAHAELMLDYLTVEPGVRIVSRVPYQKRLSNPIGTFQGGMLSAAIDETFGPLSYMTANGPCTTLTLNVTFLSAFTEAMGSCEIEATILKRTKNFIFMRADVRSPDGEIVAHAESHVKVL
jgi:acyl-coenzyme A thioesterase PaaI-like protein